MGREGRKTLFIIGGHEAKSGRNVILSELARRIGAGKLVVTTVASSEPAGIFQEYEQVFRGLGVRHVFNLSVETREEAMEDRKVRILDDATAVFFTGGDQLKITSQIGDTPIYQRLREIYEGGGVIAGTSAGAAVMGEAMLLDGGAEQSHKVRDSLRMAPGLGFIVGAVVDQHFAERGRMGRLIAAVGQNPKNIGIGIDENTAIVVENEKDFYVIGEGAVYVLDGTRVTHSNLGEAEGDRTMSIHDLTLHVLGYAEGYDLIERRPKLLPQRTAARLQKQEAEMAAAKGTK